jgi:hypothetical protein
MATIQSSDLDFNTIKNNLKTYFQQQSEFADYNFEASGLSNILDVLAYNTHLNGLIANIGINESFLNSSQLRSSVVSHAENLGYYPRSTTASSATVTLSLSTTDTTTSSVTLPKNTIFTGSSEQVNYNFQTLEEYTATNDGSGNFSFKTSAESTSIPIKEGSLKTKTFFVGETNEDQVYVIPDVNMDTSTMQVNVFDTSTSSSFNSFINVNNTVRVNTTSRVYIVREIPNGYYEVIFSDGNTLGLAPKAGNKIVITYLTSNADAANEISTFEPNGTVSVNGVDYNLSVTTVSNSSGGAVKESISSIKLNAPTNFSAQQRLVTAEDYKALILQNYSSVVADVSAWGGNENVPPVYGRVYVSLNFKDGIAATTQTETKNAIISNLSDNLSIMSIDTIFVDPITSFLETTTTFNMDPDQTSLTANSTENSVQSTINTFVADNLSTFDSVFRRSNLLSTIDDLSPAILNSRMEVKLQQRFTPTLNSLQNHSVNFPVKIADPDQTEHIVTTSTFTFSGTESSIKNKLGTNQLQVISNVGSEILADNIGIYNASTGVVSIVGLTISAFVGENIKVSVKPANESTIRPLRNYIIDLDTSRSVTSAILDYQNTPSVIST